ncbi:MAG: fumarylacetoacetate hydrolase family protein [Pseudomonadota bacterium]
MRICSVLSRGKRTIAARRGGELVDVSAQNPDAPTGMEGFLALPDARQRIDRALRTQSGAYLLDPAEVSFLPVVERPGKLLCLGLNYKDHAAEIGMPVPDYPILFMRSATSLAGHDTPMVLPRLSQQLDFEAELAVVIGKRAHNVKAADAHDHVFGVACFNDGSLRDYQFRASQWTPGKNFDRTGGFGPDIVTLDELPRDPDQLAISCRLNGQVVQKSNTNQHVFGVRESVEILSSLMTLEPGDVISLGTPSGVGSARKPQLWMKAGDVCEVEIEGVGVLRNAIALEE